MEKQLYWQVARTIFIVSVVLLFIIPANTSDSDSIKISNQQSESKENVYFFNGTEDLSRRKRNTLFPGTGNGNTNLEGLLASCQLTNLLLYQVLQQRSNPGLGGVAGGGLLQSGSSGFGFLNNILAPGATPPLLTTYVTTSTVSKKMTSTEVITIPLLFGNKPSPTTITRTKTYLATSEELVTLTSTIQPTLASTMAIVPSATDQPFTPILEDPKILQNVKDYSAPINSIENQSELPLSPSKPRRQKRRKYRQNGRDAGKFVDTDLSGNPSNDQYYQSEELSSPAYAPFNYHKQPDYYQEPIVNYQDALDSRRLKRRGEAEEAARPREPLLEPSYDNDASNEFPALNQCPQVTVTKTITKFVNPPASVSSSPSRSATRYDRSQLQQPQQERPTHSPAEEPPQQQPQRRRDRGDVRARLVQRQPETNSQLLEAAPLRLEANPQRQEPEVNPTRLKPVPQRYKSNPQRFEANSQQFERTPQRFETSPRRFDSTRTATERQPEPERRVLRRNGRTRGRTEET